MDFTKKVNDFGVFGNVVNNDVMESVSVVKTDEDKKVLAAAAHITSEAISDQVKKGELNPIEIAGIKASDSTRVTLVTPDLKDIKLFTEAVIKTAEDGNMCHMKDYVHETVTISLKKFGIIYKLTNDK